MRGPLRRWCILGTLLLSGCTDLLGIDRDYTEASSQDATRAPEAGTTHKDATTHDEDSISSEGSPSDADACTIAWEDDASTLDWLSIGDAEIRAGYLELTPGLSSRSRGAAMWPTQTVFDAFDLTFDFSITTLATDASTHFSYGLGFVALQISSPQAASCLPYSNLCLLGGGVPGFAIIIDTFTNGDPAPAPFVGVVDTATYPGTPPMAGAVFAVAANTVEARLASIDDMTPPPNSTWHTLQAHISGGQASVLIDGASYLFDVPLPTATPFSGYWGFIAATGISSSFTERNTVRNVSMTLAGNDCHPPSAD
jgi:hypothetical protein